MNTNSKPVRISYFGRRIFYVCPKCGKPITFRKRYMGKSICLECGQRLDWSPVEDILIETIIPKDTNEAAWIAERYFAANGMNEQDWFDIDEWRRGLRGRTPELYLLFQTKKGHGRFMREYGKEPK